MAEFTGKDMTLIVTEAGGARTLTGLTKVTINEVGRPKAEQKDITDSNYTVYTEMTDPLGGKGTAKATMTVEFQDSATGYADSQACALVALGGSVAFAAGTTTDDVKYDHTAMQLTKRQHKITWDQPVAHGTLTYEANAVGTWGSVT